MGTLAQTFLGLLLWDELQLLYYYYITYLSNKTSLLQIIQSITPLSTSYMSNTKSHFLLLEFVYTYNTLGPGGRMDGL